MTSFYKQIIALILLGMLLIGVVTGAVYFVMEGPDLVHSILAGKILSAKQRTNTKSIFHLEKNLLPEESRIKKDGQEYIKINIYELYNLCQRNAEALEGKSYVMRGMVYKPKEQTKEGQFGLMRATIWCCAADATAFGFLVPSSNIDKLTEGSWIAVYGRPVKKNGTAMNRTTSDKSLDLNEDDQNPWIFETDSIEFVDEPRIPFIIYFRENEPYMY
jgi:uncharacterized membrane protein YcgQ (UPF0703/DUF1980 family)